MLPYSQPEPYFGQWGEDRWLAEHLTIPQHGVFVDIGAGDGLHGSNSRYFENTGWSGLCVDPDPRNRAALAQRQCVLRTCAVASQPGRRPFSMYNVKPSWSGLGDRGSGYTAITVDCRTLENLLRESGIATIDLLSIDVEGDELDVWASFDASQHSPGIVIVEYDNDRPDRAATHVIRTIGVDRYELLHQTPANLILRSREDTNRRRWASV